MASKVLRFLHVVLPFNSTAVARLDERCSLHKQLKSHVHWIFLGSQTPPGLCQHAKVHRVLKAFLGGNMWKLSITPLFQAGGFINRCGLWGHFPHLKPIIFTYTSVLAVVIAQHS